MNYQGPKPGDGSSQEAMAKSKLASYVYEYLVHNNAPKAAEAFKNEVLGSTNTGTGEPPGFLVNWFSVFWDLYSAAPERRDKGFSSTAEARGFYDYGMIPGGSMPPMMNGLHGSQFPGAPPNGMGLPPGAEGYPPTTFAGGPPRFGGPPNAGMPSRFPPGAPMPYDMRMAAAQRMQTNARMPTNFPQSIRPMRPGSGFPQFIDSPSGTPPFQNPMMPNGVMCSSANSLMSSPGPGSHPGVAPDGSSTPQYNPMMGMPGGSGMPNQFMSGDGVSTPTSSSAGPTSVGGVNGSGMPTDGGSLSNLLNGDSSEMKQSPASVHGGSVANGGTPGGHGPGSQLASATGPGSAAGLHGPSSVQSQPGAPNSVAPNSQHPPQAMSQPPQQTPTSGADQMSQMMDFQQGNPVAHGDEAQEISKIKASLIDDFPYSSN
ncbi:single-stranded DNA-binding protein 2-related [Aphelenchoides avenae]|nr:single-stranded DNA-binding protein 2-related [Aphelenchus avenae]